jgi:hypothetical protein
MATQFERMAELLFPYFPEQLRKAFVKEYAKNGGNADLALQHVRTLPDYQRFYPGNRREDGSLRFGEQEYARQVDGYRQVLQQYDIPASVFESRFGDLISGNVRAEEFQRRVDSVFVTVMSQGSAIREAYARLHGLSDLSDAALVANAIDPSLSLPELQLQINRGQIAGAAQAAGFNIDLAEASRLQAAGLGFEAAQSFYRRAQGLLPTLSELVGRHNDPDDTFDLSELTDAMVLGDAGQMRRLTRLSTAESSLFSESGTIRETAGRQVGLRER